jgi:hypothetical protein
VVFSLPTASNISRNYCKERFALTSTSFLVPTATHFALEVIYKRLSCRYTSTAHHKHVLLKVKVKVPCNRPRRAQRGSRGIALLILDLGARRWWVVSKHIFVVALNLNVLIPVSNGD